MDRVLRPEHYQSTRHDLQAIDVIEAYPHIRGDYYLGNVIKYALRLGRKDHYDQDLEKLIAYAWRARYGTWPPLPPRRDPAARNEPYLSACESCGRPLEPCPACDSASPVGICRRDDCVIGCNTVHCPLHKE